MADPTWELTYVEPLTESEQYAVIDVYADGAP